MELCAHIVNSSDPVCPIQFAAGIAIITKAGTASESYNLVPRLPSLSHISMNACVVFDLEEKSGRGAWYIVSYDPVSQVDKFDALVSG